MRRCAVLLALASSATANAGPPTFVATVNLELNLASGAAAKPVSIAPDLSYNATSDLTLSAITSTFGTTGFRGAAGDGLCVTGASNGCPHPFDNVGGEAVYALAKGAGSIGAVGGVYSLDLDHSFVDFKLGAKIKLSEGKLALLFNPSVYIGANHRTATPPNSDLLYLPLGVAYDASPALRVGVGTGIKGPLGGFSQFGAKFTVPLGMSAIYAIDPAISIGAAFTFGKLVGATALENAMPPATGADFRVLQLWFTYAK
jgi:hypothetical protein